MTEKESKGMKMKCDIKGPLGAILKYIAWGYTPVIGLHRASFLQSYKQTYLQLNHAIPATSNIAVML